MQHRIWRMLGIALVAAIVVPQARAHAQAGDPPNPYRTVENWAKLPDGRKWGQTISVDIDRDGKSIWVFERCGGTSCDGSDVAPILKIDPSGNVTKSFGAGMFVFPHGIHVDRDGNVWVTDGRGKGGKGHQVFKFSPDGKVLMTLGKAGVAGDGPDTFNPPSDVLVAPNGDIFVADGHGGETNARIVKFSKDGKFIKAWGKNGVGRRASSTCRTGLRSIRAAGCSSAIAPTTASRSSIRTASSSPSGSSSAGRAASSSTANDTIYVADSAIQHDAESRLQARHPDRQRQGRQGLRADPGSGAGEGGHRAGNRQRRGRSGRRRGRERLWGGSRCAQADAIRKEVRLSFVLSDRDGRTFRCQSSIAVCGLVAPRPEFCRSFVHN